MAKKKESSNEVWPKVIQGSHSTRTEYEDGRVEFVTDWEALKRDVRDVIASYESRMNCEQPQEQITTKDEKVKKTRKKK